MTGRVDISQTDEYPMAQAVVIISADPLNQTANHSGANAS